MADRIKGITIEIGGDTSKLSTALKGVNKEIKTTQSDLKDVEKLLKLDPTNTELLEQKQKLLAKAVAETSEKLDTLKEAEKQAQEQFAKGEISQEQYNGLKREIIDTQQALENATKAQEEFNVACTKASVYLQDISDTAGEISQKTSGISKVAQGALAGVTALATASVSAYSEYEQLIGGVETLFKEGASQVEAYANEAYKTAGISANDYLETVTSFSASLISSLDGDTVTASEYANKAIVDMADNANKMGSDISSIQNAYKGFAKQTYTMLDNLKLGYGGTKEEMERLLADAGELAGKEFNIESYSDIIDAIHIIQENLGIAGATEEEALTTIQGSINMTKSAWSNLLTGFATEGADVNTLIQTLIDSVKTVIDNITPVIQTLWDNVPLWGQIALGITGVVAVISPIAGLVSNITGAVSGLMTILPKITAFASANPVLIIAAAVASLTALIIANWDTIKPILEEIAEKVKDVFTKIVDWGKTKINAFLTIINSLIGGLNTLIAGINEIQFDVPDWVPLFGGQKWGFNIPYINEIPLLAKGGVVGNGGTAIVGEAGAEVLTNVNGNAVVTPLTASVDTGAITSAIRAGQSNQSISINFSGSLSQLARVLQPQIVAETKRRGGSLVNV